MNMKAEKFKTEYKNRLADVKELVSTTNKASILIIQQIPVEKNSGDLLLPHVRESISNIICFVEIGDSSMVNFIIDHAIGIIDKIILDSDIKRTNSKEIISSILNRRSGIPISFYSDFDMWGSASVDFILRLERDFVGKKILLLGNSYLTTRLLVNLLNKGAVISIFEDDYSDGQFKLDKNTTIQIKSENIEIIKESDYQFDILIGSSIMEIYGDESKLKKFDFVSIYDIGLHNFSKEFISSNLRKNVNVYRFDNRAGISSIVLNIEETDYLINNNLGKVFIGDIQVVSGGIMGETGAIVVDNAFDPQLVLGVANGTGMFKSELNEIDKKNIEMINFLIKR